MCCAGLFVSQSPTDAVLWAKWAKTSVALLPCALLQFILVITHQHQRRRAWLYASTAISLVFVGLSFLSHHWVAGVRHFPWGYYPQFGPAGLAFLSYFLCAYVGSAVLLWQAYRHSVSEASRNQFKSFLVGMTVGSLGAVDFLACYGVTVYPVGFLAVFAGMLYIAQTIWRYRFMDITPVFAANELVATLPHALFGIDARGILCMANPAACTLLNRPIEKIIGLSISAFARPNTWETAWQTLKEKGTLKDYEFSITLPEREMARSLSISASTLLDGVGLPVGYVCIAQDITERQRAAEALQHSEARFHRLFESNIIGFMRVSRDGLVLDINDALLLLLGYSRSDFLQGRVGGPAMTPPEYRLVDQWMEQCLERDGVCSAVDKEYVRANGTRLPALVGAVRLNGTDGETLCFVVDSTERRAAQMALQKAYDELEIKVQERTLELQEEVLRRTEAETALRNMTVTDSLTGLYNRRGFLAMADHALKMAQRDERRIHLYFADIDNLKPINDSHGHHEGDQAITQAGATLKSVFRASDIVSRIGGDEFAILAFEEEETNSNGVLDRLTEKLSEYNRTSGLPYQLSISIGSAVLEPGQRRPLSDLMAQADKNLYAEKERRHGPEDPSENWDHPQRRYG